MIGAGRMERGEGRQTYRNGYRDRELKTRMVALTLRVPKLRQGSYFPRFLEPRRTLEKALVAVIQGEADQSGVRWTHGPPNGSAASRREKSMIWCRRWG
jgi:transposase-like protein